MNSLHGKVALVTGVSRKTGIGFGIAKRLASAGCDLFLQSFSAYDREWGAAFEACDSEVLVQELIGHDRQHR